MDFVTIMMDEVACANKVDKVNAKFKIIPLDQLTNLSSEIKNLHTEELLWTQTKA